MPEAVPNPELLHSLGRLVRGLSAIFWGLPAALIVCVGTAFAGWFEVPNVEIPNLLVFWCTRFLPVIPAMAATGLLVFGLSQLDTFQKQERPWRNALDRAKVFALITFGLSPFVFWWYHEPAVALFGVSVQVLAFSGWFLLFNLNTVLLRLGAMLPDEALRQETRQFTSLNRSLLVVLLLILALRVALGRIPHLPEQMTNFVTVWDRGVPWLIVLLGLLPLAMTMALVWKTKEVILDSVFGAKN
jgi:hypothetical protein